MSNFPPNIDWRLATLLSTVIGIIITADFNVEEQNAIGNCIMQIGQTITTSATYQQLIESRIANFKGNPFINKQTDLNEFYKTFKSQIPEDNLIVFQKLIQRINEEIEKIKRM